ncbi:BTB kelch domain protein [Elysia marginata]|uniref:BTB kelch domain protein n=1 Tax=Elysia marginata TaxID=1093978 RepID=A0AAV4GZH5_9GAST|nr:BTB kelch domain protein [Elysia marginata]
MHQLLNDANNVDLDQDQDCPNKSAVNASKLLYLNLLSKKTINPKPKIRADGFTSVISNLVKMQENEYLCDYAITLGDKRIAAHKIILAASSEYFSAAFRFDCSSSSADAAGSKEQPASLDLTHLGCQPDVLENVIQSFYTNEIDLCPDHVEDLLLLADYLMYRELRDRVETYMLETLDQDTVVLYFQLAKHYKLNATSIQFQMNNMMVAHFHDFYVHQQEVVNVPVETIENYVHCGFFKHCSPLQICTFFFNTMEIALEYSETNEHWHLSMPDSNLAQLFSLLHKALDRLSSSRVLLWSSSVLTYIKDWESKYSKAVDDISTLQHGLEKLSAFLQELQQKQADHVPVSTDDEKIKESNNSDCHELGSSSSITQSSSAEKELQNSLDNLTACSNSSNTSKVLVLVAPSTQMAAQLIAPEIGKCRPLVKHPQLELSLYDMEMEIWRSGGTIELPIVGAMLDKHAWRVALLDNCLYMFSMMKQLALEYNLLEKRWTSLTCKEPFRDHDAQAPVKSVIPVAVAGKLIVLSMSKKSRTDGTHSAQQRFYELQPEDKSFSLVSVVEDSDMEVPITQWTVAGDVLVSLKAGSMMYRQLSQLQYIHCYNARTRKLSSHKISCTMESGIKMLVRDQSLYLLDNSGWYRSYNLDSGEWTGVKRYPEYSQAFGVMETTDTVYPALSRVTCHAGTSRWQASSAFEPVMSRLQELNVGPDGELDTLDHTPPPHEFVTAMCASSMDTDKLRTLPQASFQYSRLRPKQSLVVQKAPSYSGSIHLTPEVL